MTKVTLPQVRVSSWPGEEQLVRFVCAGTGSDQLPGLHPHPPLHHRQPPAEQAGQGQHAHQREGGDGQHLQDPRLRTDPGQAKHQRHGVRLLEIHRAVRSR